MKKLMMPIVALALAVTLSGVAEARRHMGHGDCGPCGGQNTAQTEQAKKFQADTLDLRQEMMNKRFEMQRENLKGTPDTGKIAALAADITAIRTKIHEIRVQSGLPTGKRDGECGSAPCGPRGNCGQPPCGPMGGCNGKPCTSN